MNALENAKFHPIANIFPLMEGDEFEALVSDISQNGLTDPVVMLDGKILDGRNRWRACQRLGIAHKEVQFDQLTTGSDDPTAYVWSKNVVRRQLNAGQIAMAAERLETLRHGQRADFAAAKDDETSPETSPKTRKQIAKETGASPASIAKARRVRKQGAPKLAEKVETGELSLNAAEKIAVLPPEEQEEIMASDKPEVEASRREAARPKKQAVRKSAPGPEVVMKGHMTGHQSGIRDVQLVAKFWAEHAELIEKLDGKDLRRFIKDLEESRKATGQLLTLLGEKLIPEWTLPGRQPSMLSTALNKIDLAAKDGGESPEGK